MHSYPQGALFNKKR
uniref:Uncharacterized protein n=1 Tax=Arundo donax TaxID=35708 RepID=A0A0A9BGH9_ARUDO